MAVHHDRALQATETAAFYGDISFWLVGSEETPFVVFKEPNAELTQRPDWGTFFPLTLPPPRFSLFASVLHFVLEGGGGRGEKY